MKKLHTISVILTSLIASGVVYASPCSDYQRDRAEYQVQALGKKIVDSKYDGGSNVRTIVTSCNFNSYSKKYDIGVNIYWNGSLFSSNEYNSDGTITMDENGQGHTYNETYRNQALKDYARNRMIAAGAAFVFAVAAENSNNQSSSNNSSSQQALANSTDSNNGDKIWVKNNCSKTIEKLWVRLKNPQYNGAWDIHHSISLSPGTSGYLTRNGQNIRAIGDYIEYATHPIVNTTDDTFQYKGSTLKATTLYGRDSDGDRSIYLCGK